MSSVLKSNRKESQFEVFHNLNQLRKDITAILLVDFGYDYAKDTKRILKSIGVRSVEDINEETEDRYISEMKKAESFVNWFICSERNAVVDCLRRLTQEVYIANSIYPTRIEEYVERRIHQDVAIGLCYTLVQELQYAIETLPVDMNKYLWVAPAIDREINLIKAWRKSDNKFKRAFSDSASNFANVNNNGNANNNNASNDNGVRPDLQLCEGLAA